MTKFDTPDQFAFIRELEQLLLGMPEELVGKTLRFGEWSVTIIHHQPREI